MRLSADVPITSNIVLSPICLTETGSLAQFILVLDKDERRRVGFV